MKNIRLLLGFLLLSCSLFLSINSVYAESGRPIQPRAAQTWTQLVAERQALYKINPNAETFRKAPQVLLEKPVSIKSYNEAEPVQGVLTEWWCSSNGNADLWDEMWMAIIGETVKSGATAYVYLYSYLGGDAATTLEVCSQMLEKYEGVANGQVEWIQDFATDAFWMRDFGPFFVANIKSKELSIEDAKYYPSRSFDDVQPQDFAARYEFPIRDFDIFYEGGNFLPNGGGICIASSVLVGANPQYSEAEIQQLFKNHLGCKQLAIVQALDDAATGHVDMWMAWADRTTLLVGEYTDKQDSNNRAIIEQNITEILSQLADPDTGQAVNIIRVPMPSNCPPSYAVTGKGDLKIPPKVPPTCGNLPPRKRIWRTYLNVVLVNDTVILPVYKQDTSHESEVIGLWESLGYRVRTVIADHITPYQGQFHCITKTMPDVF
jgi:agmatine/peptidylarginine deiminase